MSELHERLFVQLGKLIQSQQKVVGSGVPIDLPFEVCSTVIEMQSALGDDIVTHHPNLAQKVEFAEFQEHVRQLRLLLDESLRNLQWTLKLMALQAAANDAAVRATANQPLEKVDD